MKYTVKKGDHLSKIAAAHGIKDWHDIYRRNRSAIGENPNLIHPGLVLDIPGGGLIERIRGFLQKKVTIE